LTKPPLIDSASCLNLGAGALSVGAKLTRALAGTGLSKLLTKV